MALPACHAAHCQRWTRPRQATAQRQAPQSCAGRCGHYGESNRIMFDYLWIDEHGLSENLCSARNRMARGRPSAPSDSRPAAAASAALPSHPSPKIACEPPGSAVSASVLSGGSADAAGCSVGPGGCGGCGDCEPAGPGLLGWEARRLWGGWGANRPWTRPAGPLSCWHSARLVASSRGRPLPSHGASALSARPSPTSGTAPRRQSGTCRSDHFRAASLAQGGSWQRA